MIVKAVNCSSGDTIASAEATAADKSHVLDALSKVATDLRINLYFSTLSAEQFSVDVTVEVSTGTIRALVSLLILTRWLLMHLTNKPVLSGCRYSAGNAMGIIVGPVDSERVSDAVHLPNQLLRDYHSRLTTT